MPKNRKTSCNKKEIGYTINRMKQICNVKRESWLYDVSIYDAE